MSQRLGERDGVLAHAARQFCRAGQGHLHEGDLAGTLEKSHFASWGWFFTETAHRHPVGKELS